MKTLDHHFLFNHFPQGLVFIDLETTGLSPFVHEILEFAALKITPHQENQSFSTLVKPQNKISPQVIAIHGIDDEMVADAPSLKEGLTDFFNFCEDLPLIAHNANFDLGFIIHAAHQQEQTLPASHIYDSCKLFRQAYKESPLEKKPENIKLTTLKTFYECSQETSHRALCDCIVLYEALISMVHHLNIAPNFSPAYLYQLEDFQKINRVTNAPYFPQIKLAIEENSSLEIRYQGGSRPLTPRNIIPRSLLPHPHGTILKALCLNDREEKNFILRKIKEMKPTHEK